MLGMSEFRPWSEIRPNVVTDEARVARYEAEMTAEINALRGRTIAAYLPPDVPDEIAEQLFDQIANLVHATGEGQPFDIHLVGQAGDPLHIWTEPQA